MQRARNLFILQYINFNRNVNVRRSILFSSTGRTILT